MNSRVPIALAVGAGYVLGRTHKFRWAVILGGAAATGRLNGLSTQVLERGTEVLRSSPELAKITESAGRLLDVGRQAAISAVTSRVETMSSGLSERAQRAEGTAGKVTARAGDVAEKAPGRGGRGRSRAAADEVEESDEYADEPEEAEEAEEAGEYDEADEYDEEPGDEADEEPEERPSGRGRGRAAPRSVVRKTGR